MEKEFQQLNEYCTRLGCKLQAPQNLPNGAKIHRVEEIDITGQGWNRDRVTVLFLEPPGYPASKPDCFWVEPGNFRLQNGASPQASNDGNPIPGDIVQGRSTTWFSWHINSWQPGRDTLATYLKIIENRLRPAR